jgi:hypothetical protein
MNAHFAKAIPQDLVYCHDKRPDQAGAALLRRTIGGF